eukprot:7713259-Alexandrium_andersonii.AAC.1
MEPSFSSSPLLSAPGRSRALLSFSFSCPVAIRWPSRTERSFSAPLALLSAPVALVNASKESRAFRRVP